MTDRLISLQAAIDLASYSIELCNKALDSMTLGAKDRYAIEVERDSLLKLKDDLKLLPSAQTEIMHCRDCKHWREGGAYSYCQKLFNCGVLDVYDYMRTEDDFCSLAERRDE